MGTFLGQSSRLATRLPPADSGIWRRGLVANAGVIAKTDDLASIAHGRRQRCDSNRDVSRRRRRAWAYRDRPSQTMSRWIAPMATTTIIGAASVKITNTARGELPRCTARTNCRVAAPITAKTIVSSNRPPIPNRGRQALKGDSAIGFRRRSKFSRSSLLPGRDRRHNRRRPDRGPRRNRVRQTSPETDDPRGSRRWPAGPAVVANLSAAGAARPVGKSTNQLASEAVS